MENLFLYWLFITFLFLGSFLVVFITIAFILAMVEEKQRKQYFKDHPEEEEIYYQDIVIDRNWNITKQL